MHYPESQRGDVSEMQFGEAIADPYRWLEKDVREDRAVADWVNRQNAYTHAHFNDLPMKKTFADSLKKMLEYERVGLPIKSGGRYFYTRNSGLQNQAPLYVIDRVNADPRILLDPNGWAGDGATALDGWVPSPNGQLLAYMVQDGGTDWRIIKLLDVNTGAAISEDLRWAKFTNIAWVGNEGFLYSRFPEPEVGQAFQARNYNHSVWFHRVGTSQSEDRLIFDTPNNPEQMHVAHVTNDGRYAVFLSSTGTDARYNVHLADLSREGLGRWASRTIIEGLQDDWRLIGSQGSVIWFATNEGAPLYRVVRADFSKDVVDWEVVVAQTRNRLDDASIIGNKLILTYMEDVASRVDVHHLDGQFSHSLVMDGLGSVSGFRSAPDGEDESFYAFSSYNRPTTIYRYHAQTDQHSVFAQPTLTFSPDDYAVERHFYTSKDGARIPLFLVRKKSLISEGKLFPTILYGYGGFDVSLLPAFSSVRMAWLEAGGAFAVANIRGGGEYGKAWHDAGRLHDKQNVFDDFIAAAEYLIETGVTQKAQLAIQGGSNGGLLVGAVVNQRPDLFAAANPQVGVMDMLRFDRFTAGRFWVDDYGYPEKEEDFHILKAYSPYHNIPQKAEFPAILVTTADTDDRVVPGHSFKYVAALQAADLGAKPRVIRIETRAGHGAGKPTDKIIEENSDILSFFAFWTKMQPSH